jgi:hypothetical protein
MTLRREEWLKAFVSLLGCELPTESESAKLIDFATAVYAATDPLTMATSFWIVGRCNRDLDSALRASELIRAWDDSDDVCQF